MKRGRNGGMIMDKNLMQSTYDQIYLNDNQKSRILASLENTQEKVRMPFRKTFCYRFAAVALSFVLLSGITVYAAKEFGISERIKGLYARFMADKEIEFTPEEKMLYEEYGQQVDKEVDKGRGKIKIDMMLYDSYTILIPYTYQLKPQEEMKDVKDCTQSLTVTLNDKDEFDGSLDIVERAGSMVGETDGYFYIMNKEGEFKKGDVLKIRDYETNKVLETITLENDLSGKSKQVLSEDLQIDETYFITDLRISPLSITLIAQSTEKRYYCDCIKENEIKVMKKDGNYVELNRGLDAYMISHSSDEKYEKDTITIPFYAPVNMEDIAYVEVEVAGEVIQIPVQ